MPKAVEDCVKKITGTNKRTGKPYTDSEKWAICKAANKDMKASLDDIGQLVANATFTYAEKLYQKGVVSSLTDGYTMAQVSLQKHNYDYKILELVTGS